MKQANSASAELRANWLLLLCVLLGISTPSISIYALGQFMAPLESEFGWTRSEATAGLSISLVLGFLVSPLIGRLADKVNVRLLVIPGLVLLGAGIAGFSLANENLGLWIALWAFHSGVGALVGPVVWLAVVSHVFEKSRGMAIAIALCGNNLSTAFGPGLARLLLDEFGWRQSFQLIALFWVGPALILTLFVFRDRRELKAAPVDETGEPQPVAPAMVRPALLSSTFVRLALVMLIVGTFGAAYSIHLAPALSQKGMGQGMAAAVAGVAGLAAIPGKLGTGWLYERMGAGLLAIGILALLGLGAALLALRTDNVALGIIASAGVGIAGGANLTLITILVSRFFQAGVFGVVYGTLMSLTALGAAIGPFLISLVYDAVGSYAPAFWAGVPASLIAALLMQRLKPVAVDEA